MVQEKMMLQEFVDSNWDLMLQTLEELVQIPAPSFSEESRSRYCRQWLEQQGITNVVKDELHNLMIPYPQSNVFSNHYDLVIMAHLDTVFGSTVPLNLIKNGDIWSCPGIGDDTANVINLLFLIKYLYERKPDIQGRILFVFNVCEEGLGNLAGSRKIFTESNLTIERAVSFDLYQKDLFTDCVGSVRYEITVKTEGGHSYLDFGNANAIHIAANLIHDLYELDTLGKCTYNVGTIEGGTSVNTIPQMVKFLFEYRSDQESEMDRAEEFLHKVLAKYDKYQIDCRLIGRRPCSHNRDEEGIQDLAVKWCDSLPEDMVRPIASKASTDCNIPLSLGIPAICVGTVTGGGAHTMEEWIDIASLKTGLSSAIRFTLSVME